MTDPRSTPYEAVLIGSSEGVELRPYATRLPKGLVPLGEEHSVLEVTLRRLASQGFRRATIPLGVLGTIVQAYVGDGSRWGIEVRYVSEEDRLGSLGSVAAILDQLPEHFVVVNGDVLTELDHAALLEAHIESGSPLTVATALREHRVDFGVLEIVDRTVRAFREKPALHFPVSMGVYATSKETLRPYAVGTRLDVSELALDLIGQGRPPTTYRFDGYWLDVGRPDDYERANREFASMRARLLPAS